MVDATKVARMVEALGNCGISLDPDHLDFDDADALVTILTVAAENASSTDDRKDEVEEQGPIMMSLNVCGHRLERVHPAKPQREADVKALVDDFFAMLPGGRRPSA